MEKQIKTSTLTLRLNPIETDLLKRVQQKARMPVATDLIKFLIAGYEENMKRVESLKTLTKEYELYRQQKEEEIIQEQKKYNELKNAILLLKNL